MCNFCKPSIPIFLEKLQHIWWEVVQAIAMETATFEQEINSIAVFAADIIRVKINPPKFSETPSLKILFNDSTNGKIEEETLVIRMENSIKASLISSQVHAFWLTDLIRYIPYAVLGYWRIKKNEQLAFLILPNHLMGKSLLTAESPGGLVIKRTSFMPTGCVHFAMELLLVPGL